MVSNKRRCCYCFIYLFFSVFVLFVGFSIHFYQTNDIRSSTDLVRQWVVQIGRRTRALGFQELEVVNVTISYPDLSFDELTIVQLSDLHYDPAESDSLNHEVLNEAIRITNDLKPDIFVVTGDFIMWDLRGDEKISKWLGEVNCRNKFGVLGSHDYMHFTQRPDINKIRLKQKMKEYANLNILTNGDFFEFPSLNLVVVGYGDPLGKSFRPNEVDLSEFLEKNEKKFVLALSHNPDTFPCLMENETCSKGVPDLCLAGHTHGGQIRLFGFPLTKYFGRFAGFKNVVKEWRFNAGLFEFQHVKMKKYGYVNRGIGNHLNFRMGCRPELTYFTIKKQS